MKYHERLFLSRTTAVAGISKVIDYLACHLPQTFNYPMKMEDGEMLSFLRGSLQIYVEFWNSSGPFEEYLPDFTKQSETVQQECEHMIMEIISLLKHIRSCQFLPTINTVEKMDQLQKLNTDLVAILDEYFRNLSE